MTNINDNWKELLPLIYIHIHRTVKQAVIEAISEINHKETLDAKECAEYLHIRLDCLYKKVRNDEIPYYRIGKRKLLFNKNELQSYLSPINSDLKNAK